MKKNLILLVVCFLTSQLYSQTLQNEYLTFNDNQVPNNWTKNYDISVSNGRLESNNYGYIQRLGTIPSCSDSLVLEWDYRVGYSLNGHSSSATFLTVDNKKYTVQFGSRTISTTNNYVSFSQSNIDNTNDNQIFVLSKTYSTNTFHNRIILSNQTLFFTSTVLNTNQIFFDVSISLVSYNLSNCNISGLQFILNTATNGELAWLDNIKIQLLARTWQQKNIDYLLNENVKLKTQIIALQKSVDSIKNNCCKATKALTIPLDNNGALLYQNAPNPFSQNTVIKYFVPYESKQSYLYVYDLKGTQLKSYNLNKGDCNVTIYGNELIAGIYLYSLVVDGKMVDTKQMILTE